MCSFNKTRTFFTKTFFFQKKNKKNYQFVKKQTKCVALNKSRTFFTKTFFFQKDKKSNQSVLKKTKKCFSLYF